MKQQAIPWWQETRHNDERRTNVFKSCYDRHPEVRKNYEVELKAKANGEDPKKAKKMSKGAGVFNTVRYQQETQAAREVLRDVIKEPMSYDSFEKHWISEAAGRNSTSAKIEWERLKVLDTAVIGKDKDNKETLEIEIKQQVTYRDRFTQQATVVGASSETKEPTQ